VQLTRRRLGRPSLGGLVSTRQGALALALFCALGAAGILVYALSQYRHSVNTANKQNTVLVATRLIQKGTSGDVVASEQLYRAMPIVASQAAAGALSDAAHLRGTVAARDILPGQQLTAASFTAQGGYIGQLAPTERAISIPLDASHGLATVLQAGDRVDLYAGLKASLTSNTAVSGPSPGSNPGSGTATVSSNSSVGLRLLMTSVPVLAVNVNGGSPGAGGGGVGAQADVLLKVNASDAGAVAFASDNGQIWLVLRGANAVTPKTQNGVLYGVDTFLHGTTSTHP
jgi:Flp pilus assembly protein CpaB